MAGRTLSQSRVRQALTATMRSMPASLDDLLFFEESQSRVRQALTATRI